jgi:alkylhydroperoxidase family enzyme
MALFMTSDPLVDQRTFDLSPAEKLTLISQDPMPDEVSARVSLHFAADGQVKLTLEIATMHAWNRVGSGYHEVPSRFRPAKVRLECDHRR